MKFLRPLSLVIAFTLSATIAARADNLIVGDFTNGFDGWEQFGDISYTYAVDGIAGFGPTGGTGGISQIITDTPGVTYTLSYILANDGGSPTFFAESINSVIGLTQTDAPVFDFTPESVNFVGTGSDTIDFAFYQVPGYYYLEDVSVTTAGADTPEPSGLVLLGTGILSVAAAARRKLHKA